MRNLRPTHLGWVTPALAIAVGLTLAASMGAAPLAARASSTGDAVGPLDGLAFVGETGREGRSQGRADSFVFGEGTFRTAQFAAYGFSEGRYEATPVDGGIRFSSSVVSHRSGGGSMVWEGTLRGDVLEGTMRWNHGWESNSFWFRGRVKDLGDTEEPGVRHTASR